MSANQSVAFQAVSNSPSAVGHANVSSKQVSAFTEQFVSWTSVRNLGWQRYRLPNTGMHIGWPVGGAVALDL